MCTCHFLGSLTPLFAHRCGSRQSNRDAWHPQWQQSSMYRYSLEMCTQLHDALAKVPIDIVRWKAEESLLDHHCFVVDTSSVSISKRFGSTSKAMHEFQSVLI